MKKIFTLALAASAVISAGAAPRQAGQFGFMTQLPAGVASTPAVETVNEVASRAVRDLAGTYHNAVYQMMQNPSNGEVEGEFIETMGDIVIEADPEVTNGYIVKNLFANHWIDDEVKAVNDIKLTVNPITEVITIAPGQVLCTINDRGQEVRIEMYTFNSNEEVSKDEPIMLTDVYGRLLLKSPIVFGEWTSMGGEEGIYGNGVLVKDFAAYIPNGEMSYFDNNAGEEKTCPIYGLNYDGRNLIYNFAGVDGINPAPFFRRGTRVMCDGSYSTAYALYDAPKLNPEWNINEYLFLAQIDEDGDPMGTGSGDTEADQFYIRGTIVTDTNTECVIELPDCGLFNREDQPYNTYKNVVISYNPSAIDAIETVGVDNNANAPVVYYNLQGVRVENPQGGVFIRQQGTETTKVLVK